VAIFFLLQFIREVVVQTIPQGELAGITTPPPLFSMVLPSTLIGGINHFVTGITGIQQKISWARTPLWSYSANEVPSFKSMKFFIIEKG
jgi:hypothetical protein